LTSRKMNSTPVACMSRFIHSSPEGRSVGRHITGHGTAGTRGARRGSDEEPNGLATSEAVAASSGEDAAQADAGRGVVGDRGRRSGRGARGPQSKLNADWGRPLRGEPVGWTQCFRAHARHARERQAGRETAGGGVAEGSAMSSAMLPTSPPDQWVFSGKPLV